MNNSNTNTDNLQKLVDIGISLSKEKNIDILLEKILTEAREISNSDGGTLYTMIDNDTRLKFNIMQNASMNVYEGGSNGPISTEKYYPVKLYHPETNEPNLNNMSAICALQGRTILVEDTYSEKKYDLSGPKGFDKKYNYYSKCFLNVPLKDHKNHVIGVLQLLNPMKNGELITYNNELVKLVESLASQASIALTNQLLIDEQKQLFKSFIQLVSEALEKKDASTGGHCNRVPNITMMIAEAINQDVKGEFKNFHFKEDEMEEIFVAGWLHDFGKVATPEHVMNKATKLEGLYDKIDHIKIRFEVLKRDIKIKYYDLMQSDKKNKKLHLELDKKLNQISDDFDFLKECNVGGEFMSSELKNRVHKISNYKIVCNGELQNILSKDEVNFLTLERGTLDKNERKIMEGHVSLTYELLDKLPYPKHLKNVPFFAGCHHEKINGEGYPNGYKGDELPLQARIIALADVFEGLTAPDRPYKEGYKLSKAMSILKDMAFCDEIDKDLFNLFIKQKVYLKYAKKSINSSQIDDIDEKKLLI